MENHDMQTPENLPAPGGESHTLRFTITYYCQGCGGCNFTSGTLNGERTRELRPCDYCGLVARPPRKTRRCFAPPPALDLPISYGPTPQNFLMELSLGRVLGMMLGVVLAMALLLSPLNKQLNEKLYKVRQGKTAPAGVPQTEVVLP